MKIHVNIYVNIYVLQMQSNTIVLYQFICASFSVLKCYTEDSSCGKVQLMLTRWGKATHICVNKLTIIGSDDGLPPGRRQAIIWINAGLLLIGPLGTNFNENLNRNWHIFTQENPF